MSSLRIRFDRSGTHLILLPAFLSFCDIAATLIFQPKAYWDGDLSLASDANPAVRVALGISPLLSIPAAIIWLAFISLLMTTLPPLWRQRSYVFLCLTHFVFVWGWIIRWNPLHGAAVTPLAIVVIVIMHRQIRADKQGSPRA